MDDKEMILMFGKFVLENFAKYGRSEKYYSTTDIMDDFDCAYKKDIYCIEDLWEIFVLV